MLRLTASTSFLGACLVLSCSGKPFESGSARPGARGDERAGTTAGDGGGGARADASMTADGGAASGGRTGSGAGGRGAGGRDVAGSAGAGDAGSGGIGSGGRGGTPAAGASNGGAPQTSGGAANGGVQSTGGSIGRGGAATACNAASDCPAPGTVCQKAACLGHQCGFVADPSATPPGNKPGDCRTIVCSQSGTETVLVDPNDKDDGNECTADSCQAGVASHVAQVGSRCKNGTKYCDPSGACVDCIMDQQCASVGVGECAVPKCVQGSCRLPTSGTFCNGGVDQCDGAGNCLDCVDNGGCGECCFCLTNICVQG